MRSSRALFVYGSLMLQEVFQRVCGITREGCPARLEGYRRVSLKGASYPAILRQEGVCVEGLLLESLDERHIELLDAFEGDVYLRKEIRVILPSGESLLAETYVLQGDCHDLISDQPWSLEDFGALEIRELFESHP